MTAVSHVTSRVVNGDLVHGEAVHTVNAESLNWSVLDVQSIDGGLLKGMGEEELIV